MAQDLITISQEAFALQLHKISNSTLVSLLKQIYELKWECGKHWPEERIIDIERKESKIIYELQVRGYKKKKDNADFNAFIQGINKKKRVY